MALHDRDPWVDLAKVYLGHFFEDSKPQLSTKIKCLVRYAIRESINYDLMRLSLRPPIIEPRNIDRLAQLRRFKIVEGDSFYINNLGSHFLINVRQGYGYKYFLAHEIAHTYFFDISKYKIKKIIKYMPSEEHVVNQLAEEILVPSYTFTNILNEVPSIESLIKLPFIYGISLKVILKQLYTENLYINKCDYLLKYPEVQTILHKHDHTIWMNSMFAYANIPHSVLKTAHSLAPFVDKNSKYLGYNYKKTVKKYIQDYLYEYIYSKIIEHSNSNSNEYFNAKASGVIIYSKHKYRYTYVLRPYDNYYYIQILIYYL